MNTRRNPRILPILVATALALAAVPVAAESAAELLEKGIYTEQTVGDLSAAIEIYTRIVEDAEANRPHVAQAQFRLAVCHLKRGSEADAKAAFDQLIRDFPEQQQLVALAREQLAAAQPALATGPAPWEDGELLKYRIKLPTGKAVGVLYLMAESAVVDGLDAWRLEQRKFVFTSARHQSTSRILVDGRTQRPIRSAFRHGIFGNADAVYGPGGAEISAATDIRIDGEGLYDNEQSAHLIRTLPLEPGYKAALRFLPTWVGEITDVDLEVAGTGACQVAAGDFECFEVALVVGPARQTVWISTGPERYPVKFEVEGVVLELAEIGRIEPGAPVPFALEDFGFSGVLPGRWLPYVHRETGRPNKAMVRMLDPDTRTISALEVDRCPRGDCPSLSRSAERELAGARERFEAYELRQASWSERMIDGRPAISFVGDYLLDGKPWVQYRIYTFTDDVRLELIFRTPVDHFEELRAAFDSVAESLRAD